MIKYMVIVEDLKSHEFGEYTAYGICAFSEDNKTNMKSFSDVFLEKEKAENLVNLCNANKLDIIHLRDVIEDMIG